MSVLVEIFEFLMKEGNRDGVPVAAEAFAKAAVQIDGLERMEFLRDPQNETRVWQLMYWHDENARSAGQAQLFGLPEMSLFSLYMATPPKRIGDFASVAASRRL